MVKLKFETTEEFEKLFSTSSKDITDAIVSGIEVAMMSGKRTANIFELTFIGADIVYEISLPASQWVDALDKCLTFYHTNQESDAAIDTWKLLEAAKAW